MNGTAGATDGSAVTIVCPNLGDGGAQRVASVVANEWCRQQRRVTLITLFTDDEVQILDRRICRIRLDLYKVGLLQMNLNPLALLLLLLALPFAIFYKLAHLVLSSTVPRLARRLESVRRYAGVIRRAQALRKAIQGTDAPTVLAFVGSTNILTVLACWRLGRRVVISERNDPAKQRLMAPWQELRRKVYGHADLVTANSVGAIDSMRGYVDDSKLAFLPNPLAIPNEVHADVTPKRAPSMLIVGRLHEQKAHDVLFSAFARVAEALPEWRLGVAGRGPIERELRDLARRLGMDQRIDWHGHVLDPFPLYRSAEIFVLPSRHEGTPNALLEAMSAGLPVVVSDASPGLRELVDHGVNGLVVPPDDPGALAESIATLANDADMRRRLGEAALERASRYALTRTLPEWDRIVGLVPVAITHEANASQGGLAIG